MQKTKRNKTKIALGTALTASLLVLTGCGSFNPLDELVTGATEKVETKAKKKAKEVAEDTLDDIKEEAADKLEDARDDLVGDAPKLSSSSFEEYSDKTDGPIGAVSGLSDTREIASRYGYSAGTATSRQQMDALKKAGVNATYKGGYAASSQSPGSAGIASGQRDYKGDMTLQADFGAGRIAGRTSELVDGTYRTGSGVAINGAIEGNGFAGTSNLYDVKTGAASGAGSSSGVFVGNNANEVVGGFETVGKLNGEDAVIQGGFGAKQQGD